MAGNKLTIHGLPELRLALKKLPAELVGEGGVIVEAQAIAMMDAVARAYPTGPTGNLRRGLRVELGVHDRNGATARVKSTAFHAYIHEHGSKGARAYTGRGRLKTRKNPPGWKVGKNTGVMPAGNVFVPIAIHRRRMMVAALVDLVRRAGLTVTTAA